LKTLYCRTPQEKCDGVSNLSEEEFKDSVMIFENIGPGSHFHMKTVDYPIGIMALDRQGVVLDKQMMNAWHGEYETPPKTQDVVEISPELYNEWEVGDSFYKARRGVKQRFSQEEREFKYEFSLGNGVVENFPGDELNKLKVALALDAKVTAESYSDIDPDYPVRSVLRQVYNPDDLQFELKKAWIKLDYGQGGEVDVIEKAEIIDFYNEIDSSRVQEFMDIFNSNMVGMPEIGPSRPEVDRPEGFTPRYSNAAYELKKTKYAASLRMNRGVVAV